MVTTAARMRDDEARHLAFLADMKTRADLCDEIGLAETFGDGLPSAIARHSGGGDSLSERRVRAALALGAQEEIEELAGPDASPAVRLLASRVVACRLNLASAEREARALPEEAGLIRVEFVHRMYLSALGALVEAQRSC